MNYIFLRQTQNWLQSTYDDIKPPEIWRHPPKLIESQWNLYFTSSWFEFRHSLKEIAMGAWKFPYCSDIKLLKESLNDDDWLIPCDDDDWFHPDLEQFLNKCNTDVVVWDSICNQSVFNYNVHAWKDCHDVPCSNAFALRGSVVKSLDIKDLNNIVMFHHNLLSESKRLCLSVCFLQEQLSVYNWHPGSISFLISKMNKNFDMARKIIPLRKKWLWANPELQQVQDLVQNLKTRQLKIY